MRTRILVMTVALAALAGCEPSGTDPISEDMFTTGPGTPYETTSPTAPNPVTEVGPDGRPLDPALAMVEEDPYNRVVESPTSGLTERLPDTCKLEEYQQYRGLTQAEIDAAGLAVTYRIVGPTDIVTQEYNPMRVNFYTDRDGRVGRISCG